MKRIHLASIPAQRFQVVLDGQYCTIALRQRGKRLYLDLDTAEAVICRGAICVDGASILQSPTPNFRGSLHFFDRTGFDAPGFEQLNSRFELLYASEGEELPEALQF